MRHTSECIFQSSKEAETVETTHLDCGWNHPCAWVWDWTKGKRREPEACWHSLPLLPGLLIGTPTCLPGHHGHYALKPWVQRKPFFLSCFLVKYLLTTIRGVTNTRAYVGSFILGGKECFHHQEGNMVTRTSSHPATCPGKGSRLFATHARRVPTGSLTKATEGHLVTVESKP